MTKQKKSFLDKIISSDYNKEKEEVLINENEMIDNSGNEDVFEDVDNNQYLQNANEKNDINRELTVEDNDKTDEEGQLTVDVYKTKDSIIIKSIIGGVKPDGLDISVTNDMVTIKGKRNNSDNVSPEDYYYQECFWGNFSRSIILPSDIKTDEVEASIKNGILTIKLPKIEKNASKKIEVRSE